METAPFPPKPHRHQIFLSHSGKQKGFARSLQSRLSSLGYTVFFDQEQHSLPLGKSFPEQILVATNNCKLAIVVLSDEFLVSKWPMIELCEFAERLKRSPDNGTDVVAPFTLLPLFYKLSPADIKDEKRVKKWRQAWKRFQKQDGQSRFDAGKCEAAVTKLLPILSGILNEWEQGQDIYMDLVVKGIFSILKPLASFTDASKKYSGRDRLSNVLLDKFIFAGNNFVRCILGMYGIPGSGKTTICGFLCDVMSEEFTRNVFHVQLPKKLDPDSYSTAAADIQFLINQYSGFLSKLTPLGKLESNNLTQMRNALKQATGAQKIFLVLDGISSKNKDSCKEMLRDFLSSSILGSGSRVMVVAQSYDVLKDILIDTGTIDSDRGILENLRLGHWIEGKEGSRCRCSITEVPGLSKSESMEIIRVRNPSMEEHLMTRLLHNFSSSMCIPFMLEQLGVLLMKKRGEGEKELEAFLETIKNCPVQRTLLEMKKRVEMNFELLSQKLQDLFFDIALFIIPAGYSKLDVATPILSRMHDMELIEDLKDHCFLSVLQEELRIHDILTDYALSVHRDSTTYVSHPSHGFRNEPINDNQSSKYECRKARVVNISAHVDIDHKVQNVEHQEIHLQVEVGEMTRAVLVSNPSRYSKCILRLSGNLSSLVCLVLKGVQQFAISPSGSGAQLSNLVRFEWRNHNSTDARYRGHKRKWSNLWGLYEVWDRAASKLSLPWGWCKGADYNDLTSIMAITGQMKAMQAIIFTNTGTRNLGDIGQQFPNIEVLEVCDDGHESMAISVGNAVKLKRLVTGGRLPYDVSFGDGAEPPVLQLGNCPELKQIFVSSCIFQFNPTLSITFDQLSGLEKLRLTFCRKVGKLDFTRQTSGHLETVELRHCPDLTQLSIGPGRTPKLQRLTVEHCQNLRAFEDFENILLNEQLQRLNLNELPELECNLRLGNASRASVQVEEIRVCGCPHVMMNYEDPAVDMKVCEDDGGAPTISVTHPDRLTFMEGQFKRLSILQLEDLENLQEIKGIQHLVALSKIGLRTLPNLTSVQGAWPESVECIYFVECPVLHEIPRFYNTPGPYSLVCVKCAQLVAVEGCFRQMTRLEIIDLRECGRMQVFPMEDLIDELSRRQSESTLLYKSDRSLRVSKCKFATVEMMQRWLREAEFGSLIFEAAVECLIQQHVREGTSGALEALLNYFSVLKEPFIEELTGKLTTEEIGPSLRSAGLESLLFENISRRSPLKHRLLLTIAFLLSERKEHRYCIRLTSNPGTTCSFSFHTQILLVRSPAIVLDVI